MGHGLLPGERDDFLSESEELGEILLALVVDEVVEVLPVEDELNEAAVRDVIEKNNNPPPRPNSPPPQLDRFVPLSDHIKYNCRNLFDATVKNHSEIFKTLKFFLRISI